ncbi:hypothetical protein PHMEG_0004050 [Phytophthora megakarya]|uniref:Uncharacterized protein n=1 Tax=Phytophthora megakarya TaxID=4795 RepID=A0A225WWG6_9STRA|nr:hypothetical protein PHMEG_0004050 [Phytophthora megakarya]
MIRKRNISIDAADFFFLRLVRVKTSEEQGLSLFPDADFATSQQTAITLSPDVPLVEPLNAPPVAVGLAVAAAPPRVDTTPTIYAHVNRVLDRVAAAGVAVALTSHSFRRGFNYIFNTSRENHMIAKVLSGYQPTAAVPLQDLSSFDTQTLESIGGVQRIVFAACYKLETESFNVNTKHLIENFKRQDARMDELEAKLNGDPMQVTRKRDKQEEATADVGVPKKKQRRGSVTHLHATWFSWYAHEPRWQLGAPKQQWSKAKMLVAFMKVFLADGFVLDQAAVDYRDHVMEPGECAETAILTYPKAEHKINSRCSSAVLKHLQGLHSAGSLNAVILRHQRLHQTAAIQDPAPGYTQDVLEVSK